MKTKPYQGTCLVNGRHRPGSAEERECPLRNAAARSERSRRAAAARWGRDLDTQEHQEGAGTPLDAPGGTA